MDFVEIFNFSVSGEELSASSLFFIPTKMNIFTSSLGSFLLATSPIFFTACGATGSGSPAVWRLFDLEDGGVGLHDGHNDFVDVVLESVVDLLLFVNSLHQLCARYRIDLGCQGVREGGRH